MAEKVHVTQTLGRMGNRAMTQQRRRLAGIALLGMGGLLLVFGISYAASRLALAGFETGRTVADGMGGMMESGGIAMMGSGAMMGSSSATGGPVRSATPVTVRTLSTRLAATASIDRQTNTVVYGTKRVLLVALASPEGGPDMTWNIDGLVNPTVVIPQGARVTVDFFNADADHEHGWELTRQPPPYQYMTMMYAAVAQSGAFAMPVGEATSSRWFGRTLHFTASTSGTFYYLCPVPGHAQKGMYGRLVVR